MLERTNRHAGLWIALTVLTALCLALICWLATGPQALTPSVFRWGFYPLPPVGASSSSGPAVTMAGDAIITDRNAPLTESSVFYTYRGRDEVVLWRVYSLGRFVAFLQNNALSVWGLCGGAAILCAILWLTAPKRRIRRMQQQMLKTFTACGARFDAEEDGEEY